MGEMDDHVDEYHAFKAVELIRMVKEHNRVVAVLEGEPVEDLHGNVTYEGGMQKDLSDLTKAAKNGGVHVKPSNKQLVVLWTLVLTVAGGFITLGVALIQVLDGH